MSSMSLVYTAGQAFLSFPGDISFLPFRRQQRGLFWIRSRTMTTVATDTFFKYCISKGPATPRSNRQRGEGANAPHLPIFHKYIMMKEKARLRELQSGKFRFQHHFLLLL